MGKVTTSGQNNITSPNGNSLAVFVDGITEVMKVKDVMGNIQPLSDFTGCISPFEYNANGNGIEPILGANNASGSYSTIGGGQNNTVSSALSTIIGGQNNNTCTFCNTHIIGSNISATQTDTTFTNCISAENLLAGCFVSVGANKVLINSPTIPYAGSIIQIGAGTGSTERCGLSNNAQGCYSVVTGGKFNCAFGDFSTISGGICNCTYSNFDTIAGGQHNVTCANQSIIGGGSYNTTNGDDSTIAGGSFNTTFGNFSIIGGGCLNNATNTFATVGGGYFNTASNTQSTVGGGFNNTASGYNSAVGGGKNNISSNSFSTVGGGYTNSATANWSTVGGGVYNVASSDNSTIGGGKNNNASGSYSAILGGKYNNTCNFANAMIVGSNLCATQSCTTFMNCASADNLTVGCLVSVGTNKVLENSLLNVSTINSGLFAQTTNSIPVTATAVESSLIGNGVGTLTVPANGFTVGSSFNAFFDGRISSINTATLIIRVKTLSGAILADTGIINMETSTNKAWKLDLQFTIRTLGTTGVASISSGGTFSYVVNASDKFDGFVLSTVNSTTFDTTIDNTLVVTAQWNTNNAGNSILSRNFVLTKVY